MSCSISVIVPVYNAGVFLKPCLDSLLAQKFSDFELILVDDGSSDGSGKICDEYAEKDVRIIVLHKVNEGVSAARNDALNLASGKWISFCDSDDFVEEDHLLKLFEAAEQNQADIVISSIRQQNEDGLFSEIHPMGDNDKVITLNKAELASFINEHRTESCTTIILNPLWNKLYSAKMLKGIKFDINLKVGEDMKFNFEYLLKCCSFTFLPDVLYNYRCNNSSAMHSFSIKRLNSVVACVDYNTYFSKNFGISKKSADQYNVILLCNALYLILYSEFQSRINDGVSSVKKAILKEIKIKSKSVSCISLFPQREAIIMFIFKLFGIVPLRMLYSIKTKIRILKCHH